MSRLMKRQRISQPFLTVSGSFPTASQPFGCFQAHSCLGPLPKCLSDHPDIGQGKQRDELSRVLGKAPITHLVVTELSFDAPKRMLHFCTNTGLEFLGLLGELAPGRVLLSLAFARAHGDVPLSACGLGPLGNTLVSGISKDHCFLTMQLAVPLGQIINIGSRTDHGVHQARLCIDSDMRLHPEVPLVALLGLMHLGVTFPGLVFGRAGRCDQRGIDHASGLEQQALGSELGVDDLQDLRAQIVLLKRMTKAQDADPVRNGFGAADTHEVPVKAGLEQGLFGSHVRQAKPLLQTMNAEHHCKIKRWAARLGQRRVWGDQCQQFTPRHDLLHLVEQDLFSRSSRAQLKAKVGLFHTEISRNLRASVTMIEGEF